MSWKRFKNLFARIREPNYARLDKAIDDALKGGVWDMGELATTLGYASAFEMWKQVTNEEVQDNIRVRCNYETRLQIETQMQQRLFHQQPVTWEPLITHGNSVKFDNLQALLSFVESSLITFVMARHHTPKLQVSYETLIPLVVYVSVSDAATGVRAHLGRIHDLTPAQAEELVLKYTG